MASLGFNNILQGEMSRPLLNLAAENGFCDIVTALIDEGKVCTQRAMRMRICSCLCDVGSMHAWP